MKIYTLTRRGLVLLLVCLLLAVSAITILVSSGKKAISAAAEPRDIPIYCVETEKKQVAISFDAAWGNEQTETLLSILKDKNVKATFFLVGAWVDKYPDSVKAIADAGHDVGNHSDTHAYMTQISDSEKASEIENCNEKISALIGKTPTLFRAPYGDYNNDVVKTVKSENMYCVQWDVDSLDWKDPSVSEMVEKIKTKIQNGSIILMHNGAKNTPEALPLIIDAVHEMGYEFVPISKLIPKGEYTTDHEGRMHLGTQ